MQVLLEKVLRIVTITLSRANATTLTNVICSTLVFLCFSCARIVEEIPRKSAFVHVCRKESRCAVTLLALLQSLITDSKVEFLVVTHMW
jgi:hypothetical protein